MKGYVGSKKNVHRFNYDCKVRASKDEFLIFYSSTKLRLLDMCIFVFYIFCLLQILNEKYPDKGECI